MSVTTDGAQLLRDNSCKFIAIGYACVNVGITLLPKSLNHFES
jgi:hypothetical protein